MKVAHVISSIDIHSGGPSKSVSDLGSLLASKGVEVGLITHESANPYMTESNNHKLRLHFVKKSSFLQKFFCNGFEKVLRDGSYTLFHGHGVWQFPVHFMARVAKASGTPYIITPRGMLEPWALNAGKWKKRVAMSAYQRRDLQSSDCIHATATMEAENIRKLGFANPIAVIPNGIDLAEYPVDRSYKRSKKRTLLFLSRVHPKKGIELLLQAWSLISQSLRADWRVVIAGNGETDYVCALQRQIESLKIGNQVRMSGPLFGERKLEAYCGADLFVLPTYSENFGIVVAEALACGVPVLTTMGTPWEDLNIHNAGWWIDVGLEPLKVALEHALSLSQEELQAMGASGRSLVERNYSIESVATKMAQLYDWVAGSGSKPGFVL